MKEEKKKLAAKEEELKANKVELIAQVEVPALRAHLEELASPSPTPPPGQSICLASSCQAVVEVPALRAQLEAAQHQVSAATALAVSKFMSSEEMTKVKDSSYNAGFDAVCRLLRTPW